MLDLPLPGRAERAAIINRAAGRFRDDIPAYFVDALSSTLDAISGSDLESLTRAAVRLHLSSESDLPRAFIYEMQRRFEGHLSGKSSGALIRALRSNAKGDLSVREMAKLFDKSASTIQHHLKREPADG